ncbi:hypothetical protein EOA75_11025 [Mesorhizobium sp. M1A.F.Ca.IN.022.07.1.1]|uniref:hypothetical protein n=1 Tax=unclassified Mesorhizobium TaxID=325217 RepID=UPI000FCA91C6|nr:MULTISPECIES: hypothetical protein [unclassified Mesorhizobium]RUV94646.1 hypothetical protein EOA75_11025 [Mesorhizobium sp. M1A.F.Ca.IN.022.07.1.1]RWG07998.1 MAG: hypothetical protein EOQ54_01815 [Mesorhizobium sp.]RWH04065.1 MAG: hypothetical protein EOQ72_00600 [Mesorhizobium sp.]TIN45716.1 MAG: hypothetical protein E5Y25_10460 [Mesorhizobium sp.]TIR91545.1 MAG: hypothetical protein E5X08_18420 [Mesorhizobium sp.]
MDPRKKQRTANQDETEAPAVEQQDWDALEGGRILPDSVAVNDDPQDDEEAEGTLPEEDDDNPYQESDEALPDDEEERVLARDPSKEGSRFDEV